VFIKHSLMIMVFSKGSFKVSLCCDFLRCMCSFISLEEVYRSRNAIGTMHCLNLKTVCLTH
jgi:hypothetical protein